ncbi:MULTISPECIES: PfkB family carbohydrate kinase [Eubacteriales]|uniref:Ribokinase n=1 Tax=Bittarella massiliensis (ex Durand et al. 2017) TaxID=1720313 RepID=A0AAQ1RX78_9FIRM|nr:MULTISPECIES: PfkB family carbohydrate kinase [Eubacteriales]ERJ00177.1 kinase, PfkB family [Clostridium sp. ATCC 29733]MZL70812.1 hypothetical protein [Bittarella massiliensis (ex Durand et al. 2017)]MZL81631.1 hypothetical protein [Bittarella massiliensis (ex Durand et al. 2017)]SHG65680.1 ribokinase [Bittarella massiliensis (ex Durand et al. 2017)]
MEEEILFVGTINMGVSLYLPAAPTLWDTVKADETRLETDGTASRESVSTVLLGGRAAVLGRVGSDAFGQTMTETLRGRGVDVQGITVAEGVPSGMIFVHRVRGEQAPALIYSAGANDSYQPGDLAEFESLFEGRKTVVISNRLPACAVTEAAAMAKCHGAFVLLSATPVERLPLELYPSVDIILPNEADVCTLTGRQEPDLKTARLALSTLLERGARTAILKYGADGVLIATGNEFLTLGQSEMGMEIDKNGDRNIFVAALALALNRGEGLYSAAIYAQAAAFLSRAKEGIRAQVPTREELREHLRKNPIFSEQN